jgi:hypothetical protein
MRTKKNNDDVKKEQEHQTIPTHFSIIEADHRPQLATLTVSRCWFLTLASSVLEEAADCPVRASSKSFWIGARKS